MNKRQLLKFISRVQPKDGCWLWGKGMLEKGSLDRDGYGQFLVKGGRAHKIAFEHWKGKVPKGKVIDHLCRVRHCVNPSHMRVVTSRHNTLVAGSIAPAAINKRKTHCVHGHRLVGANLYIRANETRACLTCNRYRSRERQRLANGYYERHGVAANVVAAIEKEER